MASDAKERATTRVIAFPVVGGRLSMHFGHCEAFELFDVDTASKEVLNSRRLEPPAHQPGVLPGWLHQQGAEMVIAGGMGRRAQQMFEQAGIHVVVGAPSESPREIIRAWLDGNLQAGENFCDH